jgi:hypothetical protein
LQLVVELHDSFGVAWRMAESGDMVWYCVVCGVLFGKLSLKVVGIFRNIILVKRKGCLNGYHSQR